MSDEGFDGPAPESIDTGEPIRLLGDFEEPASASFMGALHRRIQRRMLATDVTRLTWNGPILVVIEFLNMVFGLLGTGESDDRREGAKGDNHGND
jgi:hypothetical protein